MSSKKRTGPGRKARGGRVTPKGTVPPEQNRAARHQNAGGAPSEHADNHHEVVQRTQFQAPPAAVRRAGRRGNR